VFVIVRGFQYAWPPLAYSISSDADAARLYALVTTYFVVATGAVVTAVALLGRWIVRLLAAHAYFGAHTALPWLALGWSLYGVYQVMVVIAGRARATTRNVPAAALGLAVNIVLLFALVPRSGAGLGITGAALALCGAYIAMIAAMRALTRSLFPVAFEWRRLVQAIAILAAVAVSGELLLSPSGAAGFLTRLAWLALVPALLLLTRFFSAQERAGAGSMLAEARRRIAAARSPATELEAYAEDPLRDL
jgi:O-antigen/teichoic acid export membrane protein